MNLATVFIITLLSISAFAKTPYEVCDSLFSSEDKIKCLEIVKGKQFNSVATDICDGQFTSQDKLTCLATIADKAYVPGELKVCGEVFTNADKISCLARVGGPSLCPSTATTKATLSSVVKLIETSNYQGAYASIVNLLNQLQNCQ